MCHSQNYHRLYVQPAPPSSTHRHPFPQRSPSPPNHHRYCQSPLPNYQQIHQQSPSPPAATTSVYRRRNLPRAPGVRIIEAQEQHRIVQDMDTGISVLVPVMQVSSLQMGLDLLTLMRPVNPEGFWSQISSQSYTPHSMESVHESRESCYLPPPCASL